MRVNPDVARVRAQFEGLEQRFLMASVQSLALVGPVPKAFRLLDLGSKPQAAGLYAATNALTRSLADAAAAVAAEALAPFNLNRDAMKQALAQAPLESAFADDSALVLPLPMPDGSLSQFKVVEAPIMEAGLAAQFPDIKTYRGIGIDDPTASVRLDLTPMGFHAQVLSRQGAYYIDPFFRNDAAGTYVSYYKRDALRRDAWSCGVVGDTSDVARARAGNIDAKGATPSGSGCGGCGACTVCRADGIESSTFAAATGSFDIGEAAPFGTQLRTYRAAVAATGEYTAAVGGGTQAGGQAAIVTAMNRVSGVYETELAIRMVLVANNSSIVYTNDNTDPYINNPTSSAQITQLFQQNQSNLDSVIGNANYDIGHVFTTGSGGVAYLGVVGNNSLKAGGTTGLSNPVGDVFYIDYVAHEMGHQFGANHTFNTASNSQRNASTAYEPGSGSTIMAYAGITGAEDLQPHSDPYFHSASIDEIRKFVTESIPLIGTVSNTSNNAPIVSAGADYTIPTATPFALTASGSDPDGHAITFEWQQRDKGAGTLLTSADNGASPLFRDYVPSTSPTRMLPRLSTVLAGQNNTAAPAGGTAAVERLYTVARTSTWRVIARDNRAGGGGLASDDMVLTVVNTGAAFSVTSPNTAVSWGQGSTQTVTWNVAGTTANGINTANVKISLSTDGGQTFPTILAASTPNDGSQPIVIPNIATSTARIKVEAVGNIFFDISNTNFTITAPQPTTISGQTFEDRNGNGVFDGGEPTINDVRVFLDGNNNGVQDPLEAFTDTAGSGNYSFASLPPATYHVRQVVPATHIATAATAVTHSVGGGTVTQNFGNFPVAYSGTSSADSYELRMGAAAPTPYGDHFNRAALNAGTYAYSTTATGDGGASIVGEVLTLTNDATAAANAAGAVFVTTPTSAFGGFSPILNQSSGLVTWRFNMQQIRSDPSGFGNENYGVAFVLAASNNIFTGNGAGNGYAVAVGNNGGNDRIKLVRFAGGLGGTITAITEGATDASNKYWSIKVTYDPATSQWKLHTRDDGSGAFSDPQNDTNLNQVGSTVANTTYTATPLNYAGALWNYSTSANQTAKFDNFSVNVAGAVGPLNNVQVLIGGNLTYTIEKSMLPWLKFNLGDGDDTFTINYANGNPMPPGGVFFDGGSGANDRIIINGSAGSDSITLSNALAGPTAGNVNLNNATTGAQTVETITFNGVAGADTLSLNAGSYAFNTDAGAGSASVTLNANAGTSVAFNASQHLAGLSISDATISLAAHGSRVINTGTLSITGAGKLDLSNNDMIVRAGVAGTWNGSNYSGIQGLVRQGQGGGTWSGNGIVTSQTAALASRGRTTLGVGQASNVLGIGAAATAMWGGETVNGNAVLVKYTHVGDSDLNGILTADDYFNIDNGFPSATGFFNGDFDYNGKLNADDYFWLDRAYATQPSPL